MSTKSTIEREKFSSEYDLVHGIGVLSHNGDEAIMDHELFVKLSETYGENFMALIGGKHYMFKPIASMPSMSAAIPEQTYDSADSFLVKR
jgi:hypothetical protein